MKKKNKKKIFNVAASVSGSRVGGRNSSFWSSILLKHALIHLVLECAFPLRSSHHACYIGCVESIQKRFFDFTRPLINEGGFSKFKRASDILSKQTAF